MLITASKKDVGVFVVCLSLGVSVLGGAVWYRGHKKALSQIPSLTETNVVTAGSPAPKPKGAYAIKSQAVPFAPLSQQKASISVSVPPLLPTMPVPALSTAGKTQTDNVTGRRGLHVASVFLGSSGRNVAVLSNGKKQVTAREGEECDFGYVSDISREGLYLDGEFVEVSKTALAPSEEKRPAVVPAATPLVVPPQTPGPQPQQPASNDKKTEEQSLMKPSPRVGGAKL